MESSSQSKKKTTKTLGRRKIEMKRIEKKSTLQVTFSKRRTGLFKKASELSVLCGSEIAILVQSPAQKMFSFGHPSVDSTISRYLNTNSSSGSSDSMSMAMQSFGEDYDSSLKRLEYTEAVNKLEMEKKALLNNNCNDHSSNINKQEEAGAELEGGLWFDKSIEFMGIDELEEYLEQLKGLSDNVQRLLLQKESMKQTIDLESVVGQPQNIITGTTLVGDWNVVVVNQPDRSDDHKMTMQDKLSKESEVVVGGPLSSSSLPNLTARERLVAGDDDESLDSFMDSLLVDADMFDYIYGSDEHEMAMQNKLSQESEGVVGGSLSSSSSNLAARDDHIECLAGDDVDSFIDSLLLDDEMLDFSELF